MSWPAFADLVNVATRDTFGEPATYAPQGGAAPVSLTAVFEENALVVSTELGVLIRSGRPGIGVVLADIPVPPRRGDQVTIRSTAYKVQDVDPDGQGGAKLLLNLVSP